MVKTARSKSSRRRRKAWRRRLGGWLLPVLGPPLLGLVRRTWRIELRGAEHLDEALAERGVFIALWHGRMLLGMAHHGGRGWNVLVSPSDDGGLAKIMLERYGYQIVRGSSSRGGSRAVRQMLAKIGPEHGTDPGSATKPATSVVVVTPDGPRGPRHSTNPGLAWLARETGCAVLPVGLVSDRAWRLKSWDAFTIPKPWARIQLRYGDLMRVPKEAHDESLADFTETLAARLVDMETAAFEELGRGWDHPSA